jgi:hypothetical protein
MRAWTFVRIGSASLLGVLALLLFFFGVSESWFTVIRPDAEQIAGYHFGSEAMLGHGGWTYANPEVYGWTSLVGSFVGGGACSLLALALVRKSSRLAGVGLGIWLALVLAMAAFGDVQWERRATHEQLATWS